MDQSTVVGAVALLLLAVYGYAKMFSAGRNAGRIRELLPRATVIDVRTSDEYKADHLAGSMNIPVDKISRNKGRLGDPNEPKVLYCASGARARQAARVLRSMGFRSVHIGGTLAQMRKLTS